MFLTKRKFFSRKNRNNLYLKYREDYDKLSELCREYELTRDLFNIYIEDYSKKKYIYNYLLEAKNTLNNVFAEETYEKYKNCSTECSELLYDITDYSQLDDIVYLLSSSISLMNSTMDFIQYLAENELIIRRP